MIDLVVCFKNSTVESISFLKVIESMEKDNQNPSFENCDLETRLFKTGHFGRLHFREAKSGVPPKMTIMCKPFRVR